MAKGILLETAWQGSYPCHYNRTEEQFPESANSQSYVSSSQKSQLAKSII
jgi:hypothetical protein